MEEACTEFWSLDFPQNSPTSPFFTEGRLKTTKEEDSYMDHVS